MTSYVDKINDVTRFTTDYITHPEYKFFIERYQILFGPDNGFRNPFTLKSVEHINNLNTFSQDSFLNPNTLADISYPLNMRRLLVNKFSLDTSRLGIKPPRNILIDETINEGYLLSIAKDMGFETGGVLSPRDGQTTTTRKRVRLALADAQQTLAQAAALNYVSGTALTYVKSGLSYDAAISLQNQLALTAKDVNGNLIGHKHFLSPENVGKVNKAIAEFIGNDAISAGEQGLNFYDAAIDSVLDKAQSGALVLERSDDLYQVSTTKSGKLLFTFEPEHAIGDRVKVVSYGQADDGTFKIINDPDEAAPPAGSDTLPIEGYEEAIDDVRERAVDSKDPFSVHTYCFAAGTPVELPDGTSKPIEQIKIGDEVLAYDASDRDGQGDLAPRRVTRTYATPDKLVIDFHGLKVTPGHVFLCGDGEFAGQHRMLMEILRSDGTIVGADGTVLRAATNAPVESREDAFVQVAYLTDGNDALMQSGRMRAGTLILTPEGESKTVLACLEDDGYRFDAETGLIAKDGEAPHALYWYGEIPRPEDYVLKRSELTDADLYAEPGYQPEVAASAAPSKLGRGFTPAEGTLHATAAKQAGETIH